MESASAASLESQRNAGILLPALGRVLLGLGIAGIGALSLGSGDFALQWQPVPEWIPGRANLPYVSGVLLVIAGASLTTPRTARIGGFALAAMLAAWVGSLNAPRVAAGVVGAWVPMFELIAMAASSWVSACLLAPSTARFLRAAIAPARLVFGLCLPPFGVAHFIWNEITAGMVPVWIPARMFWASFTGVAHVAAGASIVSNVVPRLGATLLAVMFTSFAVLVNLGRALELGQRVDWTGFCVATALSGAAWIIAGSYYGSSDAAGKVAADSA